MSARRVYFIKPVGLDGPIKVGCSYSPDGRRKTLETWCPFALEIVAEIDGGIDTERRFHALFVETHLRREWFGWSRRIAATIEAIRDGSFDVAALPAPVFVAKGARRGKGSRSAEWSPERRFFAAYHCRRRALTAAGSTRDELPFCHSWHQIPRDELVVEMARFAAVANIVTLRLRPDLKLLSPPVLLPDAKAAA
jgi:hypothetical protein